MTECKSCNVTFENGAKFCGVCGKPVTAVPAAPLTATATPNPQVLNAAVPHTQSPAVPAADAVTEGVADAVGKVKQVLTNTVDYTDRLDGQDISQNKVMAVLSYLGPLVLIPWVGVRQSKYVRFHVNQSLVLYIGRLVLGHLLGLLPWLLLRMGSLNSYLVWSSLIGWAINITYLVFVVLGIYNAGKGTARQLPFIGKFRVFKDVDAE